MTSRRRIPLEPEPVAPHMCTVDRRLSILRRVPFFASVAAEDIAATNRQFHERGYAAGETIYMARDIAARLYVVAVGRVKVMRHTLAGQDVVLGVLARASSSAPSRRSATRSIPTPRRPSPLTASWRSPPRISRRSCGAIPPLRSRRSISWPSGCGTPTRTSGS